MDAEPNGSYAAARDPGAIFLKGFKEAIGVPVVLVASYLAGNIVITAVGIREVLREPRLLPNWRMALFVQHGNPLARLGIALVLFPKLALALSGFETGVAVMPLIRAEDLAARVRNTRKLLVTAASIMSVFLMATSVVTTLLIQPAQFKEGGEANGRALAYLGHKYLGNGFGSFYDFSTILILAFAGASALAGLLNLIPRYLPRFGMADSLPSERGRAGRGVRYRSAGAHDVRGYCGNDLGVDRMAARALPAGLAGVRFLIFGEGDVAPVTHEVLRRAIPDPRRRPVIHVS